MEAPVQGRTVTEPGLRRLRMPSRDRRPAGQTETFPEKEGLVENSVKAARCRVLRLLRNVRILGLAELNRAMLEQLEN